MAIQKIPEAWAPGPDRPDLPDGVVDVWAASLEQAEEHIERFRKTLADDECARVVRFASQKLRDRYAVGRGLLREILSRYLEIAPAEVRFEYGPKGKPALSGECASSGIRFNVSHSETVFLCAVARGMGVGIDIEAIVPRADFLKLAQRFFAATEAAEIRSLPEIEQLPAFYACWTRKEAYGKAKGSGLSIPLNKFKVTLLPGAPPTVVSSAVFPDDSAHWKLFDVSPHEEYAAALAVAPAEHEVTWRAWKHEPAKQT